MEADESTSNHHSNVNDENQRKSILDKIKLFLGIRTAPDTTEELEHEIQELLEEGEEQGLITIHEERLINSIFNFRETEASEIMTPSAEIVSADVQLSVVELIDIINKEGYTRIPIYQNSPDHIIGILHAKDLLRVCSCGQEQSVKIIDLLNPVVFIAESKPITELLRDFQLNKTHMAIVVDEFGGVRGLITLEDVIEEIVGEIDDEHDDDEQNFKIIDDSTIIADAKIDIEKVETYYNIELPDGPYESIGGFIIHQLGKVPLSGATVQNNNLMFKVLNADQRKIKSVKITKIDEVPSRQ